MVRWRSIIEPGPNRPRAFPRRTPPPRPRFSLASLEAFLYRVLSLSLAGILHLLVAGVLIFTFSEVAVEEDRPLQIRLVPGRGGGDETKPGALRDPGDGGTSAKAEPEPPKPEPKPEPPAETAEAKPVRPVENPAPAGPVVEKPSEAPDAGTGAGGAPIGPAVVGPGASAGGSSGGSTVTDKDIEKDPTEALRKRRAGTLSTLRGGTDRAILVVSGTYDRVQEVLDRLDIPHRVISPEQLPRQDLSRCKALLINCHNAYAAGAMEKESDRGALEKEVVALEAKVKDLRQRIDKAKEKQQLYRLNVELLKATSELDTATAHLAGTQNQVELVKNLQGFVSTGGYLFTSDWGLTLLDHAFPGYVKVGGHVGPRTVSIRPKSGAERHPLLEEVFLAPARGSTTSARKYDWDVDSSSYSIRIEKPAAVEVLVDSPDLSRYPAVAVTFRHEQGRILHVLSHFQKQATKQGDYALQNMLVNFLIERAEGRVPQAPAPSAPAAAAVPLVAPSSFRVVKDDATGISLPVPEGWEASSGGEASTPMVLSRQGFEGRGSVKVGPRDAALSGGAARWDDALGAAREILAKEMEIPEVTRKTQAFCGGSPAMMICLNYTTGGRRWSALQFLVAAPKSLYVVSWSVPAEDFKTLESAFDKASRGFTFPK